MGVAVRQAEALSSSQSIQLLVPIYNEGENVVVLYNELMKDDVPFDTLTFVYDIDDDITLPFIEAMRREDSRVSASKNEIGPGVVNALQWGFSQAKPGPVIVLMGDNSDKLSIIPEMIAMWQEGKIIVSPSRYMKGGEQHGGGFIKSGLSRLAGISLKILGFPTADPTNNFKLYDGQWLSKQKIESEGGFEIALELCYKAFAAGKEMDELPTVWRDRTQGESRFKLMKWLPHYLRWYFKSIGAIVLSWFSGGKR